MKIILKKDMPTLGSAGETKEVKNGYARNYLIPQKIAVVANIANLKIQEAVNRSIAKKENAFLTWAKDVLEKTSTIDLEVTLKANDDGRVFGSVTNIQLSDALKSKGFDVNHSQIKIIDQDIKSVGEYKYLLTLHKEVSGERTFKIKPE